MHIHCLFLYKSMVLPQQERKGITMGIKEFAVKVQKAVKYIVGEECQVNIQEVRKNNNIMLQGLVIHSREHNVSPTIYLDSFWEAYEEGVPFAVIMERILSIYDKDTPKKNIDMSFFKDFEKVKDRICYRLVSAEANKELLCDVPYVPYLDLAICFYYAYQGEELGAGSILIHNSHMEMWKTDKEVLYRIAEENTPRLFPWEYKSLEALLKEMMQQEENITDDILINKLPLQILSNENRVHGASCILYPGVLKQLADEEVCDLYIIPSSVHEVIILPDTGDENPDQLRDMIEEVNATQVEPEEILSNNLYYFQRHLGQVKVVQPKIF